MLMRLSEVIDGCREVRALREVAGRMPLSLHSIFFQCELNHRMKE
jgi:hypothetical protein